MTKARDLANASTALSAVSATELAFVDGVTSAIQTQMDAKAPSSTAVTLTDTQTLTNKTLTSPVIASVINNTLTSTTGDIIYASAANTPARLGIGTTGQVLNVASGVPAWATPAAGSYTTIVAETSFGSVTGVTITSIAGTYKNLVLIISNQSFDQADRLLVRPNSSSANSPSSTMVQGNSGETVTTAARAQWQVEIDLLAPSGTNNSWVCEFPNYASGSAKIMRFNGAYLTNGSLSCSIIGSAAWFNTTAISSINIKSESGYTFDSGTYALYGVN